MAKSAATSLLFLFSCALHAQVLHLQPPYDTSGSKEVELWPHSDSIIADAKKQAQKFALTGFVWPDGRDTYRFNLASETYYLTANTYNILSESDRKEISNTSTKSYPGNCAFYIYDKDLHPVSSHIIKLGDGRAPTHCNGIEGVSGVAYHGRPALLAVFTYFYTNEQAASSISSIGSNYIQAAALLTFTKLPDGNWSLSQDETCFIPTNTIDTLDKAKEKLKTCN